MRPSILLSLFLLLSIPARAEDPAPEATRLARESCRAIYREERARAETPPFLNDPDATADGFMHAVEQMERSVAEQRRALRGIAERLRADAALWERVRARIRDLERIAGSTNFLPSEREGLLRELRRSLQRILGSWRGERTEWEDEELGQRMKVASFLGLGSLLDEVPVPVSFDFDVHLMPLGRREIDTPPFLTESTLLFCTRRRIEVRHYAGGTSLWACTSLDLVTGELTPGPRVDPIAATMAALGHPAIPEIHDPQEARLPFGSVRLNAQIPGLPREMYRFTEREFRPWFEEGHSGCRGFLDEPAPERGCADVP